MEYIDFANIRFKGLNRKILLKEENEIKIITTVNSEFIVEANKDKEFNKLLSESYATFDGMIPYTIAKLKNMKVKFEKISGSDFIYDICIYSKEKNKRIFLLGGYEKSNKAAQEILSNKYNISVGGYSPEYQPYPFKKEHTQKIMEQIEKFKPDFLLVGFGAKKQEMWINENKDILNKMGVKYAIGVGGTFELVSGQFKRAPKIVQNIGLEGLWRLIQEPSLKRMMRLLKSVRVFKYC